MVNTKVPLCGIEMDTPIIPASGTFGFGYEFAELYDINMLGTFSFKGTTREPRFGNPTPRIAEYAGGLLNAVGLQNPGVDAVIATELPKPKVPLAGIMGLSISIPQRVTFVFTIRSPPFPARGRPCRSAYCRISFCRSSPCRPRSRSPSAPQS